METPRKTSRLGIYVAAGLALFAFAMTYDLAAVRPHVQTLRALERQRSETHRDLTQQVQRRQDCRELAELLGVDDLSELTSAPRRDAVTYLSDLLADAGVQVLDLAVTGGKRFSRIERTDLLVRASGDFSGLLAFVRRLEGGRRLARIEDFEIEPSLESGSLEGRFSLALFDPIARTEP